MLSFGRRNAQFRETQCSVSGDAMLSFGRRFFYKKTLKLLLLLYLSDAKNLLTV
jgi:hypothetical protein